MPTVLSASAPSTFEIKSAELSLVALMLKSADLARLGEEMTQRYGDIPDFFDHDPLLVDLTPLQAGDEADRPVDFPALTDLLRQFRLRPVAVRGGSEAQIAAAELAGLMRADTHILDDIERHDYDVFSRRASVSKWGKLRRLPAIWWDSRTI